MSSLNGIPPHVAAFLSSEEVPLEVAKYVDDLGDTVARLTQEVNDLKLEKETLRGAGMLAQGKVLEMKEWGVQRSTAEAHFRNKASKLKFHLSWSDHCAEAALALLIKQFGGDKEKAQMAFYARLRAVILVRVSDPTQGVAKDVRNSIGFLFARDGVAQTVEARFLELEAAFTAYKVLQTGSGLRGKRLVESFVNHLKSN